MDAGTRRLIDYERAVPDLERPREAERSPVIRCERCHKPLGILAGDRLTIRSKGREWLVSLPARITCDCGATRRLT
jgi:RNase P subunit RPR2